MSFQEEQRRLAGEREGRCEVLTKTLIHCQKQLGIMRLRDTSAEAEFSDGNYVIKSWELQNKNWSLRVARQRHIWSMPSRSIETEWMHMLNIALEKKSTCHAITKKGFLNQGKNGNFMQPCIDIPVFMIYFDIGIMYCSISRIWSSNGVVLSSAPSTDEEGKQAIINGSSEINIFRYSSWRRCRFKNH